eukprot:467892-Pleurochrysis_carterae.AAC.1
MLSPIKKIGERTEPSSVERRGTRSAGKQPLSMAERHSLSTPERRESAFTERRETRSAEKRVPGIVEERAPDTITSSKHAKATGEQVAPPASRAPSADAENATPVVGKAAAPAAPRAATTRAPAKAARPMKRKIVVLIPQQSTSAARDETTLPTAEEGAHTSVETTVPAVGNVATPSAARAPTPATALDDTGFSTMVAHIAQLAGNIGQVSNQLGEIGGTVKELAERVDRQSEETRTIATKVVQSALTQLPRTDVDTPPKAPPPPPERMEPLAPQRPPDAPGQIFAPRPMAVSSSGFQPRLESTYPDSGRPDRRSEAGHADGWHYCANAKQDASMRSQMTLGRTHSGAMPSFQSQRPASFATRNCDIWSQTQGNGLFSTPLGNESPLHPFHHEEEVDHGYETRENERELDVERCVLHRLLIQHQTAGSTGDVCVLCATAEIEWFSLNLPLREMREGTYAFDATEDALNHFLIRTLISPESRRIPLPDRSLAIRIARSLSQVAVLYYPELPNVERNG